jgi:putative ABC transport system permease protein
VTSVVLKGILGRKLRTALTALSIVLGIAMVSGTYVLTDTIKAGFSGLFTTVYQNADAVISGKSAIGDPQGGGGPGLAPSFPASLLTSVRGLDQVADAGGSVAYPTFLVGKDGKLIASNAGGLGFGIDPARGNSALNPLKLVNGRWPTKPDEIAIDVSTSEKKHVGVGDRIGAVATGAAHTYRVVGTVKLGQASIGGTTLAVFDLATGQRLFNKVGRLDSIDVAAKSGVSPPELVQAIEPILPATAVVRTGQAQAAEDTSNTSSFTNIIQYFLLAFGFIALFVGIFVIANTLSITVSQRTRELATLRTLGATRKQVRRSVIVEGFVIGLLASIVGLFLGLGLAKLLNQLFIWFGIELPTAGTVFATRTVIVSLLLGTIVTVLASLVPAVRATRVEPIAAVREGAQLPKSRIAKFGFQFALITLVIGVALLLYGSLVTSAATGLRLLAIGIGVLVMFLGVALVAPRLVGPLAGWLGGPGARVGGTPAQLAQRNAMRNPSRTAATASALMIGLALVTLVAVLAAGLKTRFESAVDALFVADYAVTSQNGFIPTGVQSGEALAKVPGVLAVSAVRAGEAKVFGSRIGLTGVDPKVSQVIDLKWTAGSPATPAHLGARGAIVAKEYAKDHDLHVGSPIVAELPSGKSLDLVLRGIFDPPKGGTPFGDVTISTATFDRSYENPTNLFAFAKVRGGVTEANTKRLKAALKAYPDAKVQTEHQFKKNQERGIDILLNLLYVLLSLSIVISLVGIVNTLFLTVFERTRELGMLRAVGMTRWQVRSMITYESVVTALIGATLGIPIGVGLGALVGHAIGYAAFTVPWVTLVAFIIVAIVIGMLAAIFPARRAGRLNVLEALQYE